MFRKDIGPCTIIQNCEGHNLSTVVQKDPVIFTQHTVTNKQQKVILHNIANHEFSTVSNFDSRFAHFVLFISIENLDRNIRRENIKIFYSDLE